MTDNILLTHKIREQLEEVYFIDTIKGIKFTNSDLQARLNEYYVSILFILVFLISF